MLRHFVKGSDSRSSALHHHMHQPGPYSLRFLLKACKHIKSVLQIHATMIVTGIFSSGYYNGKLIASYARAGDLSFARKVYEETPQPSVTALNAIIIAYSRLGSSLQVLNLYLRGCQSGIKPDSTTFTMTIKACANLGDLVTGKKVRSHAVESGYKDDVFVASSLVNFYAKCGKMVEASKVFDEMPRRDPVTWTTMITCYAQTGKSIEAINMYREMQRQKFEVDEVVMVSLMQSCSNIGDPKLGLSVHGHVLRINLPVDIVMETSLVDMYAKNRNLKLASYVFERMVYRNVVSWSALISGFAQNGRAWDAFGLLVEMQRCGYKPDHVSLVSILLACSQVGHLKFGKSIHAHILRTLDFDEILATAVIDMYSKCGSLSSACVLFNQVKKRDLISWNAMISIYGIHGYGEEALVLFLQMKETGLVANHATFASLLSAFSHSGMIEEGLYWFGLMGEEYHIEPSEKHYSCMIDLLARAGRVEEAYKIIQSMVIEPGVATWVALLAGCSKHRKLELGQKVARKVVELRPGDPGIYTLVANIFAAARNWNEVSTVRNVMKQSGMKKIPGFSVIEVDNKFYTILMEDKRHHLQHEKMEILLDLLDQEMRMVEDFDKETDYT